MAGELLLEARNITKHFGETRALEQVSLPVQAGRIHALVGENGAGKSTLGKIIAGTVRQDSGTLHLDGQQLALRTPRDALRLGITMISQELALLPARSVEANILLGIERSRWGHVDRAAARQQIAEVCQRVDFGLDMRAKVGTLRIADQQKVEILKALVRQARIVVMDEPTASLSYPEAQALMETMRMLRAQGTALVFISHHLDEVLEIADSITVLRNGRVVGSGPATDYTRSELIIQMLGKPLEASFPARPAPPKPEPVLEVRGLSGSAFSDVSFRLQRGEILGVAGLIGSGRSELMRAIVGADHRSAGSVFLDGRERNFRSPHQAMAHGLYLIGESRKEHGLFLNRSVVDNVSIAALAQFTRAGVVRRRTERHQAMAAIARTDVRATSVFAPIARLSGGNQQKVLFSRVWLCKPKILIVDEPTRGVDVGAKFAIHELLVDLVQDGVSVVVVSSEHEEVIGLSHRLLVMRMGRIVSEFTGPDYPVDEIKRAILVGTNTEEQDRMAVGS